MESRIDARRKDYKKSFDDPLRRREEEQVQIRKNTREAQLYKKRLDAEGGITGTSRAGGAPENGAMMDLADGTDPGTSALPASVIADVMSDDPARAYNGVLTVRRCLSVQFNPPIREVVNAGLVQRFVQLMVNSPPDAYQLQFECAWALTNVASGDHEETMAVQRAGAIPVLVKLMYSPKVEVREQAIWALGNIAGDCPELRAEVLNANMLPPLIEELRKCNEPDARTCLIRYATWTLSNLCRGSPPPSAEMIEMALPVLRMLLYSEDADILTDACWTVSYLSDNGDGPNHAVIDEILRAGIGSRLVHLMDNASLVVVTPALRAVGNIVTGDDAQTQTMLAYGCLVKLKNLLGHTRRNLRKEACWALSNITAGNRIQIQNVIDLGIIPLVALALAKGEFEVKREAAWCLANAVSGGDPRQVQTMVEAGVIAPLVDVLDVHETMIVTIALEAIENILKAGAARQSAEGLPENPYTALLEEANAFPKFEKLQYLQTKTRIQSLSVKIMSRYLDVYVDNSQPETDAIPSFGGMN